MSTNVMPNSSDEPIEIPNVQIEDMPQILTDHDTIVVPDQSKVQDAMDRIINKALTFQHIYNGMLVRSDDFFGMIEFKIKAPKVRCEESEFEFIFKNSNSKYGWFIVDGCKRLVGPFKFNGERFIRTGKRMVMIGDEYMEITNIDNDKDNIIPFQDNPEWMLRDLMQSIACVERPIERVQLPIMNLDNMKILDNELKN